MPAARAEMMVKRILSLANELDLTLRIQMVSIKKEIELKTQIF